MNIRELERSSPHWMYDVRDQLKRHVYGRSERAFAAGDAARDAITSPEALQTRQRELRAFLIASLGDLPPMDTALEPQIVGASRARDSALRRSSSSRARATTQCEPLGDNLARYFLHDSMRALDYL